MPHSKPKMKVSAHPEPTLEPVVSKLERFVLYETKPYMYLVASDKMQSMYHVLKIDRCIAKPQSLAEICSADPIVYDPMEMVEMLDMIHEGNKSSGGLVKVAVAYGIVGFVVFLDCYYLSLITQRRKVGAIGGNIIYAVKATETFPIKVDPAAVPAALRPVAPADPSMQPGNAFVNIWSQVNRRLNPTPNEIAEARYLSLFHFIDLTKDFYYSYTYDLTNSLQHNMTAATSKTFPPPPFKDMYAWNFFWTRELEALAGHLNSSFWVLPIIHGAFLHRKCDIFGQIVNMTLIARRSRHFAGTRYLKRGVSDTGKVANDVEVEQIVHVESVKEGMFSSFVQIRGSIPTYWTQESSVTLPKPPIVLSRVDPTYSATQAHFSDLLERYGSPVLVLDLVKQTEKHDREVIVGREYRRAVDHMNSSMPPEHRVRYCALDFSHISKHRQMNVLKALQEVAQWTLSQVGFFCSCLQRPIPYIEKRLPSPFLLPLPEWTADEENNPNAANTSQNTSAAMSNGTNNHNNSSASTPVVSGEEPVLPSGVKGLLKHQKYESQKEKDRKKAEEEKKRLQEQQLLLEEGESTNNGTSYAQKPTMQQQGVLRTNCIDCLDRTNVAQFSIGVHVLGSQLYAMGISSEKLLDSGSQIVLVLVELYSEVGDHIAMQYGGSQAHKKVASGSSPSSQPGPMNKHKDLLTSIRRYYSNAFTDRVKQDAMNLFLGNFVPRESDVPLWELESDYYLHNTHVEASPPQSMKEYKKGEYFPPSKAEEASEISAAIAKANSPHKQMRRQSFTIGSTTTPLPFARSLRERRVVVGGPSQVGDIVGPSNQPPPTFLRWRQMQRKRIKSRDLANKRLAAMSQWWRDALQRHAQQRMWMHLGPPKQGQLPPRFVRFHEPYQLTFLDEIFAAEFAVPISISRDLALPLPRNRDHHAARRRGSDKRSVEFTLYESSGPVRGGSESGHISLGHYVRDLSTRARHMLGFVGPAGPIGERSSVTANKGSALAKGKGGGWGGYASPHMDVEQRWNSDADDRSKRFVGDKMLVEEAPEAFRRYSDLNAHPDILLSEEESRTSRTEFEEYMKEFTLDTGDVSSVQALQRLTEESHCVGVLCHGRYEGLPQHTPAKEVEAACMHHEEQLSLAVQRGLDLTQHKQVINNSLEEMGFGSDRVKSIVENGLNQLQSVESEFAHLLSTESLTNMASSLTTSASVDMYNSYFSGDSFLQPMTEDMFMSDSMSPEGKPNIDDLLIQLEQDLYVSSTNQYMLFNAPGSEAAKRMLSMQVEV